MDIIYYIIYGIIICFVILFLLSLNPRFLEEVEKTRAKYEQKTLDLGINYKEDNPYNSKNKKKE